MTMNDTWGYKSYDHNWKSTETLIRNLVDIASKGGNYLLNVGPTSEGLIPAPSVERLKEIGQWMKVNGEAIYGTTASPFKRLPWGRCTKKLTADGAILYLHVFNWPADGKLLVPGLKNTAEKAWLLADAGKAALATESSADGMTIAVPATAPDPISTTVVLRVKGALDIQASLITQAADGSLVFPAIEARLHGTQLQYESGESHDNIGYWLNPDEWVDWQFKAIKAGKFEVTADIAGLDTTSFVVGLGSQKLKTTVKATGNYSTFQTTKIGTLEIAAPGQVTLSFRPVKDGWHPLNLRAIRFKPAN